MKYVVICLFLYTLYGVFSTFKSSTPHRSLIASKRFGTETGYFLEIVPDEEHQNYFKIDDVYYVGMEITGEHHKRYYIKFRSDEVEIPYGLYYDLLECGVEYRMTMLRSALYNQYFKPSPPIFNI